uniref:Uncharacterized protein n=1 Tax=Arundo donax TaxID=35708 RepID=A0A0A8ZGR0_ARUDO
MSCRTTRTVPTPEAACPASPGTRGAACSASVLPRGAVGSTARWRKTSCRRRPGGLRRRP